MKPEDVLRQKGNDAAASLAAWLDMPTTKLLIGMIPATVEEGVLKTLLEDCFNHGFTSGGVSLAMTLLRAPRDGK